MFSPNGIGKSHRSPEFYKIVDDCRTGIQRIFGLEDYDILFLPGSGTFAMQAVINSVSGVSILRGYGKFTERWQKMKRGSSSRISLQCLLETSRSLLLPAESDIVDCISSFPYYDIPDCKIFITCTGKQLKCYHGICIVGVRKDFWDNILKDRNYSVLDLLLYKDSIPVTYPTHIFYQLLDKLMDYEFANELTILRRWIDKASDIIVDAIGSNNFIGETQCPVLTIKEDAIPIAVAEKWQLYKGNGVYQIFTYSEDIDKYKEFARECMDRR